MDHSKDWLEPQRVPIEMAPESGVVAGAAFAPETFTITTEDVATVEPVLKPAADPNTLSVNVADAVGMSDKLG